MARRARIIPPRPDLKRKAVNFTTGLDLRLTPEVVRKLERVVHESREGFTRDIGERLAAMRRNLAGAGAAAGAGADTGADTDAQRALVARIYESSLEIKGAGGTIGYDLLTQIGKSLNDFVHGLAGLDARQARVVELHIDALYAVLANRITGRGGIIESAVVEAFGEARRRLRPAGGEGGDTGGGRGA